MKLIDYTELFKENKVTIIASWMNDEDIPAILKKYSIQTEFFIQNFAFKIFDYYICVVEKRCDIGECPVIETLLEYLKDKNVGINELFVICKGLKNAFLRFCHENGINSFEIQQEIINIYEKNFEGVSSIYVDKQNDLKNDLMVSSDLIDENIIMSSTDLDGMITSVSTAFCEISGFSKEELIGKSHNIVRHPDTPNELFDDLWNTIKSGKVWHGEIRNLKKDGSSYWVDATIGPEYDSKGKHTGYSAIRQDITYKKQSQTQQDIIIEQSKATAMGEMISMIAHQWRQPLQAIAILVQKLTLEKMIEGSISEQTLNSVVDSIEERLSYMSKIIEDFRSFFNPVKDKETIYASALVDQVRDFMAYSFKVDDIHFNIEYDEDVEINIHVNEMIQVFVNILNNAKEALDEKNIENKKINLKFYKQNDNIVFEVSDNALGIPNVNIKKVFEPYFSTKKNKNGTGLGLYMAKTIVEKNAKGILSVQNTAEGACFKIVLPIE